MATIKIVNVSNNDFTLIVGRMPVNIPAHRRADNPVDVHIRDDLLPALLKSIRKRPVLRVLPVEVLPESIEEKVSAEGVEEPAADRAEFMSACKATKAGDGVWDLTLPDGKKLTVEAGHHLQAKEMAFEMLYAAPADKE